MAVLFIPDTTIAKKAVMVAGDLDSQEFNPERIVIGKRICDALQYYGIRGEERTPIFENDLALHEIFEKIVEESNQNLDLVEELALESRDKGIYDAIVKILLHETTMDEEVCKCSCYFMKLAIALGI